MKKNLTLKCQNLIQKLRQIKLFWKLRMKILRAQEKNIPCWIILCIGWKKKKRKMSSIRLTIFKLLKSETKKELYPLTNLKKISSEKKIITIPWSINSTTSTNKLKTVNKCYITYKMITNKAKLSSLTSPPKTSNSPRECNKSNTNFR